MNEQGLPFDVGDTIVHMKDPYKERHSVIEIVKAVDGNRFLIKSEDTGENMLLIISGFGLAGWKKVV